LLAELVLRERRILDMLDRNRIELSFQQCRMIRQRAIVKYRQAAVAAGGEFLTGSVRVDGRRIKQKLERLRDVAQLLVNIPTRLGHGGRTKGFEMGHARRFIATREGEYRLPNGDG
jgi:hypothetical protein